MKVYRAIQKIKISVPRLFLFFSAAVMIGAAGGKETVSLDDISSFKSILKYQREQNKAKLLVVLKNKKNLNYAEKYLTAYLYAKDKNYITALSYYTSSAFRDEEVKSDEKSVFAVHLRFSSAVQNGFVKSPLYANAVYEISDILADLKEFEYAKKFLSLLSEDSIDKILDSKIKVLKANILTEESLEKGVEAYEIILKESYAFEYALKLSFLYEKNRQYKEALDLYFSLLKDDVETWAQKDAAERISKLYRNNKIQSKNLNDLQKINLAEALRIHGKLRDAERVIGQIDQKELLENSEKIFLYSKINIRILMERKKYQETVNYFKSVEKKLSENEYGLLITDTSDMLAAKGIYKYVLELVPFKSKVNQAMVNRLRALIEFPQESAREEAQYHIENLDKDSTYAETVYFNVCLNFMVKNNLTESEKCLLDLMKATENVYTGGRSRYFLAKMAEEKGNIEQAKKYYSDVYTNSPGSSYVFAALKKRAELNEKDKKVQLQKKNYETMSISDLRNYIAEQGFNEETLKILFSDKKNKKRYGIDSFWHKWQKDLDILNENSSEEIKKAALFTAMGLDREAYDYFTAVLSRNERFIVCQKVGLLTEDTYLSYAYLKTYLYVMRKEPDVFLLSPLAIEVLYPLPYREEVKSFAQKYDIEEAKIYALMKQESSFHPGAISRSGARGLMQLMPKTANWLNKRIKIKSLDLFNPEHSIWLGVKYYTDLYKKLDYSFEKSAIAYNAGPGRLRQWQKEFKDTESELFLEWIPIRETNNYVKLTRRFFEGYSLFINIYYN
ncbi:MAG: lytic transglycosylase domain-containing protein [Spirochaetia bacterium]|nr:lytic transglycosylase domain-containing protein [Spirochaetia bacterium]